MKWISLILIAIAMAILLSGCTRKMLIVYDTKIVKEQFLPTDQFRPGQMDRLERRFINADYQVEYYGIRMVITSEMIEAKKGKRYILKRKFTEKLQNPY